MWYDCKGLLQCLWPHTIPMPYVAARLRLACGMTVRFGDPCAPHGGHGGSSDPGNELRVVITNAPLPGP